MPDALPPSPPMRFIITRYHTQRHTHAHPQTRQPPSPPTQAAIAAREVNTKCCGAVSDHAISGPSEKVLENVDCEFVTDTCQKQPHSPSKTKDDFDPAMVLSSIVTSMQEAFR